LAVIEHLVGRQEGPHATHRRFSPIGGRFLMLKIAISLSPCRSWTKSSTSVAS